MKALSGATLRELVHRLDSRANASRRADHVALGARQIYILPTRHGLLFAVVLVVLLFTAINYDNALVYLLTFLLASLTVVSFLHTQRNLLGLRISATGCDPVFAGEVAEFHVCVHNPSTARTGLRIDARPGSTAAFDVPAQDMRCVPLAVPAVRRGWMDCPLLELETHYPLGIARAWSRRLQLTARCLVYPKPADAADIATLAVAHGEGATSAARDGEDFAGLRLYRAGDPLARISWKTLARGQGLHTKEFGSPSAESVWIDWEALAPAETEMRLCLMTRAVLDADEAGLHYGLRMPGKSLSPAVGAEHRGRCLETLALHEDVD